MLLLKFNLLSETSKVLAMFFIFNCSLQENFFKEYNYTNKTIMFRNFYYFVNHVEPKCITLHYTSAQIVKNKIRSCVFQWIVKCRPVLIYHESYAKPLFIIQLKKNWDCFQSWWLRPKLFTEFVLRGTAPMGCYYFQHLIDLTEVRNTIVRNQSWGGVGGGYVPTAISPKSRV